MTNEEHDKDMIESIEMWLHEIEPKWVEKELAWLEELRNRLLEEDTPNDLEEAAKDYTDSSEWSIGENLEHIDAAFIAGAEWQAKQMMKEAVEGVIDYVYDEKGDAYKAIRLDWLVGDFGDKVKLYIVKEDEK